jgi:4-hydroxybenzoate polyprenyltransferase
VTEEVTRHAGLRQLAAAGRRYVWSARVGDFALLAAIPVLGFAFGIQRLTLAVALEGAVLAAAALLLLVHIFALNDWADYHADGQARPLAPPQARRSRLLTVSALSLVCFTVLLGSMSLPALLPAACVVVASAIYSLQWPIRGKEVLLLSSALHAVCGAACFLVGVTVAAGLSAGWSDVWVFIGLSMAGGHLHQEISDHHEDLASHARTHATKLGPHAAFILGQLMFAGAFLALLVLPGSSEAPLFRGLLMLAWAANLALAAACWREGVTPESVDLYRSRYRCLYILIGLGLLLRTPALGHLINL